MEVLKDMAAQVPEPVKVGGAVVTFLGVTMADLLLIVQVGVGVATFTYVASKTYRVWYPKKGPDDTL